jgi:undecaprenyl-diphosphatase
MCSRSSAGASLSVLQAVALGAVHGPAELLPVSSSAHVAILPWLLGWEYEELDADVRKSFEVMLHAGTAASLVVLGRRGVARPRRRRGAHELRLLVLSCTPPALVGLALERPIERHLGTPLTVAAGLLGGAALLAISDRAPQRRARDEAGALDALWLGLAQACALIPGVSRSGATLSAARLRRFTRADAALLSRQAGVPVIAGAALLKGIRLQRRGLPREAVAPFIAGGAAAFTSAMAAGGLTRREDRSRSLLPYVAYRVVLAAAIVARRKHSG